MIAYFDVLEEMVGEMEMNAENFAKAEDIIDKADGSYHHFVLATRWEAERGMPVIYADGPWEC